MSNQKNGSKKENKSNKSNCTNNCSDKKKESPCNDSDNTSNKNTNKTPKLCSFSSVDFIVLASTLAIALGEELSSTDIEILASFFAVLSDELALIGAVDDCKSGDEDSSVFVAPVPAVAATSSNRKSRHIKKKK